jgi:chromate reductase, NAD(P)H dehydrogenase (quinone)
MAPFKIGYFVGSLATGSINRVLSQALIKLAPEDLEFTEIPIKDLPLYSYDYDADFPPEGRALKEAIEASDGILFVSPEYNRSIPGALKNAIDWGSRPWGTNSFARKPTGIIGASPGGIGTAVMQSSMRSVLSFLDAPQLNAPEAYIRFDPEVFGEDGEVKNEGTREFLRHYMDEYCAFVQRVLDANAPGHIGDEDPDSTK